MASRLAAASSTRRSPTSGFQGPLSAAGWLTTDYILAKGTELLRVVEELDETAPRGWVVDLRQHYGGSVGAGLSGLQALLPSGRLFGLSHPHEGGVLTTDAWVERQGAQSVCVYRDGGGVHTGSVIAGISARPRGFRDPDVPIADLTSASTASAGEALLVALRQNLRARVFGEATSGSNTGEGRFHAARRLGSHRLDELSCRR